MVDLRSVDLNLLVTLDALLEECNVTRAAQRLHLTQPAVSTQLGRLRKLFDDPLLIPAESGRGMVPSAKALAMHDQLRGALRALESVVKHRSSFDPAQDKRIFVIAGHDNAIALIGLRLLEMVQSITGRGIQLVFVNADQTRIASQLEQGEVDLLIGSERMVPPSMKAKKLMDEHFVMAQRKKHPRGTGALDLDCYCSLSHVLVSTSGGKLHGFMDEHLERLGRSRHVAVSMQSFALAIELLTLTDFVSTLPSRLVQRHAKKLDAFPLPFEAQGFSLFAAWHPRNQMDLASKWLRDAVMECVD